MKFLQNVSENLQILNIQCCRQNVIFDTNINFSQASLLTLIHKSLCQRLTEKLASLLLILTTIETFFRRSSLIFEHYLRKYKKRWNVDSQQFTQLKEYRNRILYTTWNIFYTRLEDENSKTAQLLYLLIYFNHQNIWYKLLYTVLTDKLTLWLREIIINEINFNEVMNTLTDYCFVNVQAEQNSWSMHTYVHD